MNKVFNQRDFDDKRTTAQQLIALGRVVAPVATVVAIISIAGLLALPVLIPLWIFCYKKDKTGIEGSDENARKILSDINFTSKYEFSNNNVVISVDPESKIIAFWR